MPKKDILIVDDDLDFSDSLADILDEENCVPTVVDSGEKAVRNVTSKNFDIVLMDIKMPGMGGIEALKQIKRIKPKTRVIIMTGFSIDETIRQAEKWGAERVLYKPFDLEQLIQLINSS